MSIKKRYRSFLVLLAATFVLALPVRAEDAQRGFSDPVASSYTSYFSDLNISTLAGKAAEELRGRLVVSNSTDTKFHGERLVNRAEALKMLFLTKSLEVPQTGVSQFPDVAVADWFYTYVAAATSQGIIKGYPDGMFHPGNAVNTVEFLKMLTLTFNLEQNLPYDFKDVPSDAWYAPYAGVAQKYMLFPGRISNLLPATPLTRSEVAIALYQYLLNRTPVEPTTPPAVDTPLELKVLTHDNATVSVGTADVVLAEQTLTATEDLQLNLQKLAFKNLGTAKDADLQNLTLTLTGKNLSQISTPVTMSGGMLTFANSFPNNTSIALAKGDTLTLTLKGKVSPTLSAEKATVQMELQLTPLEISADGKFLSVTRTTSNTSSALLTLTSTVTPPTTGGSDFLNLYSQTPPSRILVAGTKGNVVSAFQLRANLEPVTIEKLTLQISEVNTTTLFDGDVAHDSDAIISAALFYSDGTPVLSKDGKPAVTSAVSNGKAVFTNLDLTVERGKDQVIFAAVDLNPIGTTSPAKSGMAFRIGLATGDSDSTVHGKTSGATLSLSSVEGPDTPLLGQTMYVLSDRLSAEKVNIDGPLVTGPQQDLLKFKLTKTQSLQSAFLREVDARINVTGDATVANLVLYDPSNRPVAFAKTHIADDGTTYRLIVGIEDQNGDGRNDSGSAASNHVPFNTEGLVRLPGESNDLYDEVSGSGIYTLRGDVITDGLNDHVVTGVTINSSEPALDGIFWRDDGGDHGDSGITMQWINLDLSKKDITRIEQDLKN